MLPAVIVVVLFNNNYTIISTLTQNLSKTIQYRARGWARLGAAHLCNGHPSAAIAAYAQGLKLDPKNPEMVEGLQLAKDTAKRGATDGGNQHYARRQAMHE